MTGPVEVYAADGIRSVADVVLASLPLSYSRGSECIGTVAVIGGSRRLAERGRRRVGRGRGRGDRRGPQPADTEGLRARSGKR